MVKPTLSEIIEAISKQEHVKMVPKFETPIYFVDFMMEMDSLVERLGLGEGYIGPGHMVDFEAAHAEGGDIRRNMKYHQYWVCFRTELGANRFMNRINSDDSLLYKAEPPQSALGFAAIKAEERIS